MPREQQNRITPRVPTDTSSGQSVPLQVQATLPQRNSAAFSLASALYSGFEAYRAGREADYRVASIEKDKADRLASQKGKDAAAEQAVTGVAPDEKEMLNTYGQHAVDAYHESDGLRISSDFVNQLRPKLAKLDPGADVDKFIQQDAASYVENANMPEASRAVFMQSVAQQQEALKTEFIKQSITESHKREEENYGALTTNDIRSGALLNPDNLQRHFEYLHAKGLTETESRSLVANSFAASIADGTTDIQKALDVLKTPVGSDGVSIGDIPALKETIDASVKRGETIQKAKAAEARFDQEVAETTRVDALARKGVLSSTTALAWGHANGKSAAEVASKLDQSARALEALQKENDKEERKRQAIGKWFGYNALDIKATDFTKKEMEDAGQVVFNKALRGYLSDNGPAITDDKQFADTQLGRVIEHAARTGAPLTDLKDVLNSIDENNPKEASRLLSIYKYASHISPAWANRQTDAATLAKITRYQTRVESFGDNPDQAWSNIKLKQDVPPDAVASNMTKALKLLDSKAPKDFGDHAWNPIKSNTPIANLPEVNAERMRIVRELVSEGVPPEDAVKAGIEKADSNFIRSGDQMVRNYGIGDGNDEATSAAMTERAKALKDGLVKSNVVDKDQPVFFAPTPGQEGVWRAQYKDGYGITHAVTEEVKAKGPDGKERTTRQFIDISTASTRDAYSKWDAAEKAKAAAVENASKTFGIPTDLTKAAAYLKGVQHIHNPYNGKLEGMTQNGLSLNATSPALDTPEGVKAAKAFVADPQYKPQSFADFLTSQK